MMSSSREFGTLDSSMIHIPQNKIGYDQITRI